MHFFSLIALLQACKAFYGMNFKKNLYSSRILWPHTAPQIDYHRYGPKKWPSDLMNALFLSLTKTGKLLMHCLPIILVNGLVLTQ